MVDFRFLKEQENKYVLFMKDGGEWIETIFKDYDLFRAEERATSLRDRVFRNGMQVRSIETGEMLFEIEPLSFRPKGM